MISQGTSRGRSFCVKAISFLLVPAFLLSNISFASAASAQNLAPQAAALTAAAPQAELVTDPEKIVVPREFGLVKSKFAGKGERLIVHIQDAHCNYEAQSNIVKILENLIRNYNLNLVSVEGADGVIDTSWFKAFPDDEVRKEVATYFMKKGEITGPEFLSITSNYPMTLFGAETRSYYIQNLNAFTSSYTLKEETEKYVNQVKSVLNRLKTFIYSEDLKVMDAKMADYESKKLPFNEYARFLQSMAEKTKVGIRDYDNFFKLISTLIYEKKIDFTVTDKERSALIDELSKKMPKEAITELVTQSISFKVGKISSVEFYTYLRALAKAQEIDLAKKYPNLYNYIIYNAVYSRIENEKLFSDIKKIETAIKERLFKNDDQRTLEKLSRHSDILLGLINIKLLNGDFDYYLAHKDEFAYEVFADFLTKEAVQYGLAYDAPAPSETSVTSVTKLEEFYTIAIKRDKALVDNTLAEMQRQKQKIAVLVTGGFHSEGMTKLLEKQGVSYMVVCPSITKDVPSPYIQILTNQRTPFEEILVGGVEAKQGMLGAILRTFAIQLAREHPVQWQAIDAAIGKVHEHGALQMEEYVLDGIATGFVRTWLNHLRSARPDHTLPDVATLRQAHSLAIKQEMDRWFENQALNAQEQARIDRWGEGRLGRHIEGLKEIAEENRRIVQDLARRVFDRLAAEEAQAKAAFEDQPGNLMGKFLDGDGNVITEIFGALSPEKNTLMLKDQQGQMLAELDVKGEADPVMVGGTIRKIRLTFNAAQLKDVFTRDEIRYIDGAIRFLEERVRRGEIYILRDNAADITDYANADTCFIEEYFADDPIALFHIGWEGYFAANQSARQALMASGFSPHLYARGIGYDVRRSHLRPLTRAEEALKAAVQSVLPRAADNDLGIQDRIFGSEANDHYSRTRIAKKLVRMALYQGTANVAGNFLYGPEGDKFANFSLGEQIDFICHVGALNAELADLLRKRLLDERFRADGYLTILERATHDRHYIWDAENLIYLGQIVRILGTLELTPQEAREVIRQLSALRENERGRKDFNYIEESRAGRVTEEDMKNFAAQQHLDGYLVATLGAIAEDWPGDAAVRQDVAAALLACAKDVRKYPGLYFTRAKAIFQLGPLMDLGDVRDFLIKLSQAKKSSKDIHESATDRTPWAGHVPSEQHFGTSPSYSDTADLRYAAGMALLRAESQYFIDYLTGAPSMIDAQSIRDAWLDSKSKTAILIAIEQYLHEIATNARREGRRKTLISAIPLIGLPAIGTVDALGTIFANNKLEPVLRQAARDAIVGLAEELDKQLPPSDWKTAYEELLVQARDAQPDEVGIDQVGRLINATNAIMGEVEMRQNGAGRFEMCFPGLVSCESKIAKTELLASGGGGGISFTVNALKTIGYFGLDGVTSPMSINDDGGSTLFQKAAGLAGRLGLPLLALADMVKSIDVLPPVKAFLAERLTDGYDTYVTTEGDVKGGVPVSRKTLFEYVTSRGLLETLRENLLTYFGTAGIGEESARAAKTETIMKEITAAIHTYDNIFIESGSISLYKNTIQNMVAIGFLINKGAICASYDDKRQEKVWFLNLAGMNNALVKYMAVMNAQPIESIKGYPIPVNAYPNVMIAHFSDGSTKWTQDEFSHTRLPNGVTVTKIDYLFPTLPVNPFAEKATAACRIAIIPPTSLFSSLEPALVGKIPEIIADRTANDRGFVSAWLMPPATDREETSGMRHEDIMQRFIDKVGRLPNVIFYLDKQNPSAQGQDLLKQLDRGIYSGGLAFDKKDIERMRAFLARKGITLMTLEEAEARGRRLSSAEVKNTVIFVPLKADAVLYTKTELSRIDNKPYTVVRYHEETTAKIMREVIINKLSTILGRAVIEDYNAEILGAKLRGTVQTAPEGKPEMAKRFESNDEAAGVRAGAVLNGSFGEEGNQGYFARSTILKTTTGVPLESGRQVFNYQAGEMRRFFGRTRLNQFGAKVHIRYVVKAGIGGQHTPFQGLASGFEIIDLETGKTVKIVGEYELGKDYAKELEQFVKVNRLSWGQIAVIPSSKSGTTDETMLIFTKLFKTFLKNIAEEEGLTGTMNGAAFAQAVLQVMHTENFEVVDGREKEKPNAELFKTFNLQKVADATGVPIDKVRKIFGRVLGNMIFETVNDSKKSRLAAFINNSGLAAELKGNAPLFIEMFDNVGGRWTADLHMMTFIAYHGIDADEYWKQRLAGIHQFNDGKHVGMRLGNRILDEGITRIAFVVPRELLWFGKMMEQNFNESIWQPGFANLVTVEEDLWSAQSKHYTGRPDALVVNLTGLRITEEEGFNVVGPAYLGLPQRGFDLKALTKEWSGEGRNVYQETAHLYAHLVTTFYGVTNTVGNRLIARALMVKNAEYIAKRDALLAEAKEAAAAGRSEQAAALQAQAKEAEEMAKQYTAANVDMSDLDNPATKLVHSLLYLRQPKVELGKKLLEKRLIALQVEEADYWKNIATIPEGTQRDEYLRTHPSPIAAALAEIKRLAHERQIKTNIPGLVIPPVGKRSAEELSEMIAFAMAHTEEQGKELIPAVYLEGSGPGGKFMTLSQYLRGKEVGVRQVEQGTGGQHIDFQQYLEHPERYSLFLISVVPDDTLPGELAVGWAKGYLNNISDHLVRDYFAEAIYGAMTEPPPAGVNGEGIFMRISENEQEDVLKDLEEMFRLGMAKKPEPKPAAPDEKKASLEEVEALIAEESAELAQVLGVAAATAKVEDGVVILSIQNKLYEGKANAAMLQLAPALERHMARGTIVIARGDTPAELAEDVRRLSAIAKDKQLKIRNVVSQIDHADVADIAGSDRTVLGSILDLDLAGKSLDQNYLQIIRIFKLSIQVAYKFSNEEIAKTLSAITGQTIPPGAIDEMVRKGIFYILPRIVPMDGSAAVEAYKAVRQALVSL